MSVPPDKTGQMYPFSLNETGCESISTPINCGAFPFGATGSLLPSSICTHGVKETDGAQSVGPLSRILKRATGWPFCRLVPSDAGDPRRRDARLPPPPPPRLGLLPSAPPGPAPIRDRPMSPARAARELRDSPPSSRPCLMSFPESERIRSRIRFSATFT